MLIHIGDVLYDKTLRIKPKYKHIIIYLHKKSKNPIMFLILKMCVKT